MLKRLPFCSKNSGPISITSCSCEKRYQALPVYTYSRSGEPENEAILKDMNQQIPFGAAGSKNEPIAWSGFIWTTKHEAQKPPGGERERERAGSVPLLHCCPLNVQTHEYTTSFEGFCHPSYQQSHNTWLYNFHSKLFPPWHLCIRGTGCNLTSVM